jgi:hypothetical protein
MSRVRFHTAREVFEAFPAALEDIGAKPTDDPPLVFLRRLAGSPTPEDALAFSAYVLPRREAVWWACQCVRAMAPARTPEDESSLAAAENWVREPEEHRRRVALELGTSRSPRDPATWAALAAAWSGGSMAPGDYAVQTQPHFTAKAARAAVLTALAHVGAVDRAKHLRACVDAALTLAERPGA